MLDWTVGQLLNALEHHGFADNTIVYFSSDQGGHTEERGLKGRVEGGHNGVFRGRWVCRGRAQRHVKLFRGRRVEGGRFRNKTDITATCAICKSFVLGFVMFRW